LHAVGVRSYALYNTLGIRKQNIDGYVHFKSVDTLDCRSV
jgi:hypothetical protein